jgi:hypothetical protein
VIGRGLLIARLREAHENHDLRWEGERRQSVQRRMESLETQRRRKSLVPVDAALQKQMEEIANGGTARDDPASRRTARHPLQRLGRSPVIEAPVPRRSPASEAKAANRELSQLA